MTALRFKVAAILVAAIVGCTPTRPSTPTTRSDGAHVEVVAKHSGDYLLLGNGRVRIYSRGEFVLDHEDAENLYIMIYAPPAVIAPTFAARPVPIISKAPVRDATGRITLIDIGQGLPHTGQWRDHFAVGDILGDGSTQIVFAPARKSGGVPLAFREQPDGWHRVSLRVPSGHYDYGGVAIADIDGDGRNDLALAMHLTGFAVLKATADGTFTRIDAGLPYSQGTALSGSGHAVLALPSSPHTPAPLLLLQEPNPSRVGAKRAPNLGIYRYSAGGFINSPIATANFSGNNLVFAPASTRCQAKLAIARSASGPPTIMETADEKAWKGRAVDSFPDPFAIISAVALGDMDGDGCSDFAVAYSSRIGNAWHSVLDVYLDRGTTWERFNLFDGPRDASVTALAIAMNSKNPPGGMLISLDNEGKLRIYDLDGKVAELLLETPTPDWRRGCTGSDLRMLPNDAAGNLRVAASFAGEPTMGQFDRCRGGGGIEAWRIEDARF